MSQFSYLSLLLSETQPWGSVLHHQAGDALGTWASCTAHDHVHIGSAATTDKSLARELQEFYHAGILQLQPTASSGWKEAAIGSLRIQEPWNQKDYYVIMYIDNDHQDF